jgi:hypothetical protein
MAIEKVSKNFKKGTPVKSATELFKLVDEKRSIYHPCWGVKPAIVICNMNFWQVHKMIFEKRLFKTIKMTKAEKAATDGEK